MIKADARTTVERPAPSNKLSVEEVQAVLAACHRPDMAHLPPTQIVPRLADEGVYLASESTFYRILKAEGMNARRGRAHPPRKVQPPTTYTAAVPNTVWSWDITYLPSPVRGQYYYLYLFEDLYSRKAVAWKSIPRRVVSMLPCSSRGLIWRSNAGGGHWFCTLTMVRR